MYFIIAYNVDNCIEMSTLRVGSIDLMFMPFVDGSIPCENFDSFDFKRRWSVLKKAIVASKVDICAFRNMTMEYLFRLYPDLEEMNLRVHMHGRHCQEHGHVSGFFVAADVYDDFTFSNATLLPMSNRIVVATHKSGLNVVNTRLPPVMSTWRTGHVQPNHFCAGVLMTVMDDMDGGVVCVGGFRWNSPPNQKFDDGLVADHPGFTVHYPQPLPNECKQDIGTLVPMPWTAGSIAGDETPERALLRGCFVEDYVKQTIRDDVGLPMSDHAFCHGTFTLNKDALLDASLSFDTP